MNDFGKFPSFSSEIRSAVTSVQYYVIFMMRIYHVQLRYRMSTKGNLSRDHLPPTLDVLVLHLRRKLIFV